MKQAFLKRALAGAMFPIALASLTACGTPPPNDFGGAWTPVNRFQDTPTEIPLSPAYTYYASPMDETLRNMLKRWAADSGLTLSYELESDYTLFKSIAKLRTTDLHAAAAQLNDIYGAQNVFVTVDSKRIQVKAADDATSEPAAPPMASAQSIAPKPTAPEAPAPAPESSATPAPAAASAPQAAPEPAAPKTNLISTWEPNV